MGFALAFVGRKQRALGHIQLAFVGHKRLPCIQRAFVERILVVERIGFASQGSTLSVHTMEVMARIPLESLAYIPSGCIAFVGRILGVGVGTLGAGLVLAVVEVVVGL